MKKHSNHGFTLLELLVALAIGGVVMAGIYSSYYAQQKSFITQTEVAEIQQNLRGAMSLMVKEIRMAGCDPTGHAHAGIVTPNRDSITFTLDIRGTDADDPPDGDTEDGNERIMYSLYDRNHDGMNDTLGRKTGAGTNSPVAENIDALDFVYMDENGAPTAILSEIRSVQITLLARAGMGNPGYKNKATYRNQLGAEIYTADDNFRRKLLTTHIKCRNLWF